MPLPAMSGADPWIGSNIDGVVRSGLMLPPGATPRLPEIAEPMSVRMSPKRFEATMTSSVCGCVTMRAQSASTWYFCSFDVREVLRHVGGDLVPQHHRVLQRVRLRGAGEHLSRPRLGELEGVADDALDARGG